MNLRKNLNKPIFGTDGVRGKTGEYPLTPSAITQLALAAGSLFQRGDYRHRVVIGKDTRLSGYMIEPALVSGFTAVGMDVFLLGPMPTPAVSMLTRSMRADIGVMISASHNPFFDNGIKFFQHDGLKLSDKMETQISEKMQENIQLASPDKLGRATRIENAAARYIEFLKSSTARYLSLEGMRIVLDCANGAAYSIAPTLLWELGAEVKTIGVSPNGFNINSGCGSTDTEAMRQAVLEYRADIGISLDGDADRLLMCTDKGDIVDGDQLLALLAVNWSKRGMLNNDMVVCSQMSNMALDKFLLENNIKTLRTKIGDRYVAQNMRDNKCNLGGENSGHVIMSQFNSSGDGLMVGLQVFDILKKSQRKASEIFPLFKSNPQKLLNVRSANTQFAEHSSVKDKVTTLQELIGNNGRIMVRASGTEPVIRIMVEGPDPNILDDICNEIAQTINNIKQ